MRGAGASVLRLGSHELEGRHALLLGHWAPLADVLDGTGRVLAGAVTVGGGAVEQALSGGRVGFARRPDALPPWSVRDYLVASGTWGGLTPRQAAASAEGVIDELGLRAIATWRVDQLRPRELSATLLAQAVLPVHEGRCPPVVVAFDLCDGLDGESQEAIVGLLEQVGGRTRLVLGLEAPPAVGPLRSYVLGLDVWAIAEHGLVTHVGPPPSAPAGARWRVTVLHGASVLAARLLAAGAHVTTDGATHLVVELREAGHDVLVTALLETDTPLIELLPADPVISSES